MAASKYGRGVVALCAARFALEPAGIHRLAPGLHMAPGVDDAFPSWMRLCSELSVRSVLLSHRERVFFVPGSRRSRASALERVFGVTGTTFPTLASSQAGLPAEFKHITKRRKRN